MAPISTNEVLVVLASLGDAVPYLAPAAAIIRMIADALEAAKDNQTKCFYLLRRCTALYASIKEMGKDRGFQPRSDDMLEFETTLKKIRNCVSLLSSKTPLQRFLQRQAIADSVREAHRRLDNCVELFQLQTVVSLKFTQEEYEEAHQRDQTHLAATLEKLQTSNENILVTLDLRSDQIMEAIRGLRNVIRQGLTNKVERKFAEKSLDTLLTRENVNPLTPSDWAISSLEILKESDILGSGAFGTVYVGRWRGTRVAIKQLTAGTPRQLLTREIDIWRSLNHPHIACFLRACIDSQPPLLISDLYTFGNSLVYLLDHPDADRVNMCYEIALGMEFLHSKKIIHGDLKPTNVLIDNAHHARITDFGLSRVKTSLTLTTGNAWGPPENRIPGTKVYMAPERLRKGSMNYATDVYAFAMTAFHLFDGEAPFQHLPEDDLRQVVVVDRERPDRPEDITDAIWNLIESCWHHERERRPDFPTISKALGKYPASLPPSPSIIHTRRHSREGTRVLGRFPNQPESHRQAPLPPISASPVHTEEDTALTDFDEQLRNFESIGYLDLALVTYPPPEAPGPTRPRPRTHSNPRKLAPPRYMGPHSSFSAW